MSNEARTATLCDVFTQLDAAFTRHKVDAFIHLRRRMTGGIELRFHTRWPALQPLRDELDKLAEELELCWFPEHVEGLGLVVTVEPMPSLHQLESPVK